MCTVKELIDKLKGLPDDMKVNALNGGSGPPDGFYYYKELELDPDADFMIAHDELHIGEE